MLEKTRKHHAFVDPRELHGGQADLRARLSDRDGQRRTASLSSCSTLSPPRIPPPPSSSSSSAVDAGNGGNVDRVLFKNLVEMVPLVESLMEKRANSSFTRRASMVYTAAPSSARKVSETKGRKSAQSATTKNRKDAGDGVSSKLDGRDDSGADDFSIYSSRVSEIENIQRDREELISLKEQLDDLQKKLSEKDEVLKFMENSMNQMSSIYPMLDELKRQVTERDLMVKSAQSQLSNVKIKLADKQAALERVEWEAKTSNQKVEKLQGDLDTIEFEITAFMQFFEEMSKSNSVASTDENIMYFDRFESFDHFPNIDVNDLEMEKARSAYIASVADAKENPTEETLSAAAEARLRLQAFVL